MGFTIYRVDTDPQTGQETMTRHGRRYPTKEEARRRADSLNRAHRDLPTVFLVRPVLVELLPI